METKDETDEGEDKEAKHSENSEGGNEIMHTNVFDRETEQKKNYLSHADQLDIINLGGLIEASPAVYENTLVVGTRKEKIFALDIQ